MRNPLNPAFPETMYRTGDLAFWDEEGRLVYSGRKDHQIKHMGQRIELGEIEAAAQATGYVEQACCIYDAKRKRIHLFYVGAEPASGEAGDSALCQAEPASGEAGEDARLLANLGAKLPHYMVPGKVMRLETMPLTKNGKIDRQQLESLGGIRR